MCYFPILDMGERGVPPENKDEAVQKPKRPIFQSLISGPGVLNFSSILSKIVPRQWTEMLFVRWETLLLPCGGVW